MQVGHERCPTRLGCLCRCHGFVFRSRKADGRFVTNFVSPMKPTNWRFGCSRLWCMIYLRAFLRRRPQVVRGSNVIARVMHPGREAPLGAADEVGVAVGDAEVIYHRPVAGVADILDGDLRPAGPTNRSPGRSSPTFTQPRPATRNGCPSVVPMTRPPTSTSATNAHRANVSSTRFHTNGSFGSCSSRDSASSSRVIRRHPQPTAGGELRCATMPTGLGMARREATGAYHYH